ncbi:mucin-12 isoform X2 [Coregonus clupeaformis]|uniref:mucin-12 isoform X2 n=1 Tax=Coregonus clupeaformis TaxID=59861 RepID=UPI001E1C4961|nr:mucin-12 isoform X2 [Coregonus clupeaformis]
MDLNQSVLDVAQEELHLSAMMASRSTPHFKPPLTIIIPYGLKSWLECLCRAIFIEGPRQIPEFIADYCVELLEFRERNPLMDTKDVTHLYQEMREANYVKDWLVCPVPQAAIDCCLAEETLSVSQRTNPRSAKEFKVPSSEPMGGPDKQAQSLSSPPGETHHRTHPGDGPQSSPAHLGGQPSPAVEEEAQARPGSAVQSVVFQRAPSLDSLLEANHSQVLISTASAPTDDIIIIHSENLQEATVFRSDSRPYSGVSPRGSLTKIPSVGEVDKIGVNDTTEVTSEDVVVFHQVPSVENLPRTPSALSNTSLAAEETVDQVISLSSREFLLENVVPGSPSIEKVASAAALQQADTDQIRSAFGLTEKVSSSEIVGVGTARRVSSVRIPSREESAGRTAETLNRYTSPQISLLSAHSDEYLKATYKSSTSSLARVSSAPCGEREAAATISPKSSLARVSSVSTGERAAEPASKEVFSNVEETYTLPSTEDLLVSSTASVSRISPVASAIYSKSGLSGRAFSDPELVDAAHRVSSVRIPSRKESVCRTAETPERRTSPRVSPQASFVSGSPVMFEEEDWCVITTHSATVKKAVKLAHSENISPLTSPSIDLAWEELLQTSASIVDKVALKAFEIVNQKLQCSGMEISEMASSNPVVVSQSLNTLFYKDLSHSPSAVEEFSTASARCSEGDITERAPSETAGEGEAISVREITPAVSARYYASNVSERVPFETAVLGAAVSSMKELSESPTAFAFVGEVSPAVSANDVSERAPSETAVVGAEAPERHTSPKVSAQTSFVSAYSDGLLNATKLSPQSSLARIPSGYISEGVSPAVSARCPASDLPERASSETAVMESAPRVIHSAPSMDELLVLPTASVDGISPAVSARSSRGSLSKRAPSEKAVEGVRYSESGLSGRAFSETELVDAAQSVSLVRIPSREESVERTAETPERHTSPRVSAQTFSVSATGLSSNSSLARAPSVSLSDGPAESVSLEVIFNMEETYTTPSMGEIVPPTAAGDGISASIGERAAESASRGVSYMDETNKPPSMAELPGSPAAVGGISPAVSARCSQSDMAEKAPSETAVGRHTSSRVPPKVSPQTSLSSATGLASMSLARVPSVSLSVGAKEPAQIDKTLSMEELLASPLYSQWAMSPACSERVSSVRIPSREEGVGRTAETPGRHTSPRVSPRTSPIVSLQTSLVSDISQQSSLPRIPSAPSMDRHTSPRVSQKVSPQSLRSSLSERPPSETAIRYSESVLLGRALSKTEVVDAAPRVSSVRIPSREESVGRTAETPERHTSPRISPRMSPRISPRVSPQSSLARIPSAPSMEEPLVTPSAAVGRVSTARSGVSLGMSLGISAANVVGPVCFKDVSQIMPTTIPENQGSASSVRIPSRGEGVGRTAETPERHTSPRVSPRASPRATPQTSLVSAHVGESLSGTDISPQSSLPRIHSAPSMDRHTFPRVSQRVSSQSSLARIPSAPSMEELLVSASDYFGSVSPAVSRRSSERAPSETVIRYFKSDLSGRAFSDPELVDAAHRVSSVRIPSRQESVGRTAETPERHTSPRVSPRASPRATPQTSLVSAHVGESLSGTDISPQSSLPRIHSAPSMDRHTFPRVSQRVSSQSSLAMIPSAPSMEELLVSASDYFGSVSPAVSRRSSERAPSETVIRYFKSDLSGRAFSDPELVDAAHRVSSVRIPSRQESVGRTAETPERHTSPRVSPRASPRATPQTSFVSAHVGESLSGTDISPQSSLPRIHSAPSMDRHTFPRVSQRVSSQSSLARIPSAPSMEELLVSASDYFGSVSPAVSRRSSERAPSETVIRYFKSDLSGRAFSDPELVDAAHRVSSVRIPSRQESVGRTAETPERHTSPRVSPITSARVSPRFSPQTCLPSAQVGESLPGTDIAPQFSLPGIPSVASMEELLVSLTASVGRISPAVSRRSSRSSLLESASSGKATIEAVHREESVERTADATESHTTPRVSFRAPLATSRTRVLSDVAVLYRPSIAEGLCLEVLDMESDQVKTSVSDITAQASSHTAAMETAHDTVRIPSRKESARRTAETQTYFASGLLNNSTQVSGTSIRLHEEVTAHPTEVQQGTLRHGISLGLSRANVVGPQNTRSQSVQTGPDYHGPPSHSIPIGAGRVTPDAQPALENFTNQVWTLYHLANETEEGTLSTNAISQPPFNGSAFICNFGSGHVLLAERSPSPQQSDPQSWCGRPRQQPQPPPFPMCPRRAFTPRSQTSILRPPPQPPTILNQEISIPNYFLFLDGNQVSLGQSARSVPTAMFSRSRSAVVRADDPPGYLSFSVPMEMVSGGSGRDGQAQFLQVISDEGNTVYTPALIRIVTSEPTEEEDQEGAGRWPTSAPFNW